MATEYGTPEVDELVRTIEAWTHPDDWNVPSIYINAVRDLAEALALGDNPAVLRDHARHTRSDCERSSCDALIPATMSREHEERQR
jgi:hypothetical protein